MATRKKTTRRTEPSAESEPESTDGQELPGFEAAMEELQQIVTRMEDGDQSLEATVKDFERGMALSQVCQENLKRAEARIDMLVKRAGGDHEVEDFEADDDL